MGKILQLIVIFMILSNISLGQTNCPKIAVKPDTLILKVKITNTLPIGWGTKYKCEIISTEKGKMPEINRDNLPKTDKGLIFSVSAGSEKLYKDIHFLKVDEILVIMFVRTNIYNKEPYLQAGTTGFMDKQGMIWEIKSVKKTN